MPTQAESRRKYNTTVKSHLAFSIACLVKPGILILDEVFSVGDGVFRKKSEAKKREIISSGVTTILVSHSLAQVRKMSTKVLWLDKGRQIEFGTNVQEICDHYQNFWKENELYDFQTGVKERLSALRSSILAVLIRK